LHFRAVLKQALFTGLLFFSLGVGAQDISHVASLPAHSDSTFVLARELLRAAETDHDTLLAAQSHFVLGRYFFEGGSFEQALEQFLYAERLIDSQNNPAWQAKIKAHLGTAFHYSSDSEASLAHLKEALEDYNGIGDSIGMADVFGRLGHYHEKTGRYEVALDYQQRALNIFIAGKDASGIAAIYENIGSIHEDLGRFAEARTYFEKARTHLDGSGDTYRLANVYNNLGDSYRKSGDYDEGLAYTRKALAIARENQNPYLEKSALRDMAKTYAEQARYDSAFYYNELAYISFDTLFGLEVAKQIAKSKVIYETEKKENQLQLKNSEIEFLEKEQALSKAFQYTFGIAFILLLTIAIWLFRLQRQKMRSSKLIFQQREAIYQTQEDLNQQKLKNAALKESKLRTELENKRLREIYLNDQLELRSNELTSHTIKIIRNNKLLHELRDQISKGADEKNLKALQKTIDGHLRVDKNWESFQELFEKVHEDFYRKLMERAPDLSPAEIRLCCLLKLNLPSKDIAAMLGISPDSLRIARYRLRKKLNLEGKEKLSKYVIQL